VCECGEEEGRIGHTSITLLLTVVRKTPQVAQRVSSAIEVESDTVIVQDPDIACIAFSKQPRVVDWIVEIHREMPPESADEGTG
jgi:hypothetical protein